jgi:hypothetical protein
MGKISWGTEFHPEEAASAYKTTTYQPYPMGNSGCPLPKVCKVEPASPLPYRNNREKEPNDEYLF